MKYTVTRTESRGSEYVERVLIGEYGSEDEADDAIQESIAFFREHRDNDERIDWNAVDVTDDIGNTSRFTWDISERPS